MGLDFSHGTAHWSYSGFMDFRIRLAKEIGVDLLNMEGFTDERILERKGKQCEPISWDSVKSDPILDLLNHSDCDGELTIEQCEAIAPRLRELVKHWPRDERNSCDRETAEELANGMDQAVAAGQSLHFQ